MRNDFVVIGAIHPQIGCLFLERIPDSEVGYVDIYQITNLLSRADVRTAGWREHLSYESPPFDIRAISEHIHRIDWYDNSHVHDICWKNHIQIKELREWSLDVQRWKDIPVIAKRHGNGYEAMAIICC
ncbi:hypothetical protein KCO_08615 [Pectobacterium brasiliense ICMP 19477]|uniref:Uncharacterized protein n=2 Tax=Pectobacterium brasiliense TaxID=180957 RepID=M4GX52_9GAMM|nr:hypothetical protein KCO_08615 [Pectobacterium brasiliense]KMK84122.1 hypothetical protein KCO_08615 [Pectobacterium brasiliense ICMP 19477]